MSDLVDATLTREEKELMERELNYLVKLRTEIRLWRRLSLCFGICAFLFASLWLGRVFGVFK